MVATATSSAFCPAALRACTSTPFSTRKRTTAKSPGTSWQYHPTREALQAVSAEKRKNRPASLGCPAAGAPWSAGCGSCGARWCFVRCLQFCQNLGKLAHGVRPGHADILVPEHEEIAIPRPGLFLPCSAQVQLGQSLLIGRLVALGLDDDYLPGARSHDKIRIVVDKAIDSKTRSRDIAMPPPDIG